MFNIKSTVVFGKKKKKKKKKQPSDLKELLAPTYKFARPRKGWWKIMTQEVQMNDLKEGVHKLIPESTGRDTEKAGQSRNISL